VELAWEAMHHSPVEPNLIPSSQTFEFVKAVSLSVCLGTVQLRSVPKEESDAAASLCFCVNNCTPFKLSYLAVSQESAKWHGWPAFA